MFPDMYVTMWISIVHAKIRRPFHNDEWWFVIVDVKAALTDSADSSGYFRDMKRRDPELAKGGGQIAHPLLFSTKQRANLIKRAGTNCIHPSTFLIQG